MAEIETRALTEIRAQVVDGRTIRWRPILFDRASSDLGGFTEIISPRALDKTLSDGGNITADFDHAPGIVLGTTQGGTLKLEVDRGGVTATVVLPNSRDDILELVRRRDINAGSFSFRAIKDSWTGGDLPKRTVTELQLFSVSLLASQPAYPQTVGSVSVRTFQQALDHRSLSAPPVVTLPPGPTRVGYAHPTTVREARLELAELERRFNTPRVADREARPHEAVTSHVATAADLRGYKPVEKWRAWFADTARTPDTSAPAPMTLEAHRRALEAEARALTVEYAHPPQSTPTSKRFWWF